MTWAYAIPLSTFQGIDPSFTSSQKGRGGQAKFKPASPSLFSRSEGMGWGMRADLRSA